MSLDQLLLSLRDHYATYHHHKEQMAYTAATLYLAATTAVAIRGPHIWQPCPSEVFRIKFVFATALVGFSFVAWQLRKREYAADMVQACGDLLVLGAASMLNNPDLTPVSHGDHLVPTVLKERLRTINNPDLTPVSHGDHLVPTVLKERLRTISKNRALLGGPRFSELLTYFVMLAWTIGAFIRVAAACSLTSA